MAHALPILFVWGKWVKGEKYAKTRSSRASYYFCVGTMALKGYTKVCPNKERWKLVEDGGSLRYGEDYWTCCSRNSAFSDRSGAGAFERSFGGP